MESASVPETDDPKPDSQQPDASKSNDGPNEGRADVGLVRALGQIKSAEQDLARLDRLVSGMEHSGERPQASQPSTDAKAAETPDDNAPAPGSTVRNRGLKGNRPMLRALLILVLAIGVLGAAVASHYHDEARSISKSIMARLAPPAGQPPRAPAVERPAQPGAAQLAAADEPNSVPAPPRSNDTDIARKAVSPETDVPRADVPRADVLRAEAPKADVPQTSAPAPAPSSSDLALSLKTISSELANINAKLEQLKSSHEQTLREQADTIQQLKAAQQKDAADNARLAAQVQALQTQLTAPSASASTKPVVRSVVSNETAATARPHLQAAPPRRPRPPPRGPWMPPPYYGDYGDPYGEYW
jgi:hypothetical protein